MHKITSFQIVRHAPTISVEAKGYFVHDEAFILKVHVKTQSARSFYLYPVLVVKSLLGESREQLTCIPVIFGEGVIYTQVQLSATCLSASKAFIELYEDPYYQKLVTRTRVKLSPSIIKEYREYRSRPSPERHRDRVSKAQTKAGIATRPSKQAKQALTETLATYRQQHKESDKCRHEFMTIAVIPGRGEVLAIIRKCRKCGYTLREKA